MKAHRAHGFSLVELLVVLAIIAILSALIIPSISSVMRGSALTMGAQKVLAEISLAHQTALTQDRQVEVRFYRVAKAGLPGEVAGNAATGKFRALQSFSYDSSGNATALDKVQWLPDTVIMDSGAALSTLLGTGQAKSNWSTADPQVPLPSAGTAYTACVFDFQPDGSTNLNPIGQQWFVTVHTLYLGDNLGALPGNFEMYQIDPLNGHVQSYRP
jgi:uncharacterized protein (TIGR02596 family)